MFVGFADQLGCLRGLVLSPSPSLHSTFRCVISMTILPFPDSTINTVFNRNNILFFPSRFLTPEEKFFAGPGDHSSLYNAMIHPFLNMTIYGAIWYQGEANANAPYTYNCTFPAMIDDWRSKWFYGTNKLTAREFPFGFVQVKI